MEPTITETNGVTRLVLELPAASIRGVAKGHTQIDTEYRHEAGAQAAQALTKYAADLRAKARGRLVRAPQTLEEAQTEYTRINAIAPKGDLSAVVAEIEAEKEAEEAEQEAERAR